MKITLSISVAAFLLAATLLPAAGAQINDIPAEIDVTTTLYCGTNFLSVPGVYNLLISGISLTGDAAGYDFPFPPFLQSFAAPGLEGSGQASLAAPGSDSVLAKLRVCASLGSPEFIRYLASQNQIYAGYDGYTFTNGSLLLQNGETYYLAPFWTGWPDPSFYSTGDVNPLGPDPGYFIPYQNPVGITSVAYSETNGILSITLKCPGGSPAPAGIHGSIVATMNDSGEVQARLPSFDSGSGPIYLLVRSRHNYSLNLTYITSSGSDPISWPLSIANVPANPFDTVPDCVVTPVDATLLTCDINNPLPCGGAIITGFVDMLGDEVNWPDNFSMSALPGPAGNSRLATIDPVPAPVDYFEILHIVPSDFFVPYGYPDQPYHVGGQICFGMNSDYEFFQTPHLSVEAIGCQSNNLGLVFQMCPGHVQGNINLSGPVYGTAQTSPWQSLSLDRTFGSNGHDDADPYLTGTSFIGANQFDGDGAARVLFSAQTTAGGATLSGKYDLRLAGLSSIAGVPSSSTWNPNQLNLNFHSSSTAPEDNIQENLQIVDNTYTGVVIDCGVTNHHDIDYCFGEVLIKIVDTNPGDTSYRRVTVTGDIDPLSGSSFSAHFSAVGIVVPPPSPIGHANGLIRLFLPKGSYNYVTRVDTDTGTYTQPASTFAASCGGITEVSPGGPVFTVDGITPCSSDSNFVATVTVYQPVTNYTLYYTIGLDTFTVENCVGGCAQTTLFGVPLHPCLNDIIFTVSNNISHEVSTMTAAVTYSPTPPTVSCNDIVLQMPPGQDTVTVDYNTYPTISIVGGCDPKTVSFDPPNLSSFHVGSTQVTCAVTDPCNSNYCTFNVVVQPPPCIVFTNESFTCNSNGPGYSYNFTAINTQADPIYYLEAIANSGPCLSIITPIFIFPTALSEPDQNEQSGFFIVNVDPSCNQQQLCLTIVAHAQNGATLCSIDRCFTNPALPTIVCPTNIVVDCTNDSGAYVNYTLPTASGHCCALVSVSSDPPPGNFPIGVTPVTCIAIDSCGHSNSCQFSVTVRGHSTNREQPRHLRQDGFTGDIQVANAIAVDDAGNSFITGWFRGTAHFGSISLTSSGDMDIFLAKFGPDLSDPLWVQKAGGGGADLADAVAVDSQGNCYIAGTIDAGPFAVDFLKSPVNTNILLVPTIRLSDPANMFLAKYDPDGNLLWVAPANGQSGGSAEGVAIDSNDDCYLCGGFSSVGVFYSGTGGIGAAINRVGSGATDAYLAKYSSAGDPKWVVSSSGSSPYFADARSVAIDRCNDRAFITGSFVGTPAFGTVAPLEPSGLGFGRVFVAQCALSPSSPPTWTWARQTFSPPATNCSHDARQIGVDCAGNCYFTAYFNGVASIAADNKTAQFTKSPAPANHYYDYLVGSFDPTGVPRWLYAGTGSGDDESRAIAVRPDTGDAFVAGFLNGLDLHVDGGREVFLFHFDELGGSPKAAHNAIGTSHFQSNAGRGLAIDAAGCIYMTGSYTDTNLNFQEFQNVQPAAHVLNSTDGNPKTFVAKYCPFCEDCFPPGFITYPQSVVRSTVPSANDPVSFTATTGGSLPMFFFWHNGNTVLNPGGGEISTPCYSVTINGNSSTLTLTCPETGPFYVILENNCPHVAQIGSPHVGYGVFDFDHSLYSGLGPFPMNVNLFSNFPFVIQYRDDLGPGGVWHDLTNGTGNGNLIQIVDPNPNPTNRFYRIGFPANLPEP